MRVDQEAYRIEQVIGEHLGVLRPAQRRGLALWVYGTVLARSGCESAVLAVLLLCGRWDGLRQRLREWLYDGADRAAPCGQDLQVDQSFAPLLAWVLRWWHGSGLALALDATTHQDRFAVLVVSVLYRGCAIPVAWQVRRADARGPWMPEIVALLTALAPAVPPHIVVLVCVDRGLRSVTLWDAIRQQGWHPVLRVQGDTRFTPTGGRLLQARTLIRGSGHAWVGSGRAFARRGAQRDATLVVLWEERQREPWCLLTDLPPRQIGLLWYGLRVWIELGFRVLKSVGWQWEQTRRTDPTRAARHFLVLAVATLWVLAYGTRVEDARRLRRPPGRLRIPPPDTVTFPVRRRVSLFRLGLDALRRHLDRRRLYRSLWFLPEPWPSDPPLLALSFHHHA